MGKAGFLIALTAALAAAPIFSGLPARADVVMPPPPHPNQVSAELQNEIGRRFGPAMHPRMRGALSSVVLWGGYRVIRSAPFDLLIRDQKGWTSWQAGSPRPIAPAVAAEIDRLFNGDAIWQEQSFVYGQPCPGNGRVMQILHFGRDKLSRQPCGPKGLAGRLGDMIVSGRVPAGPLPPAGGRQEMIRGAQGSDYERKLPPPQDLYAARLVLFLTAQSVYALREGDAARHVEPYAQDVTVVWPDGTEHGRDALRRRALGPSWNGVEKRHLQPGEAFVTQTAPESFTVTGTYRFWDGHKESQFKVSSWWRKRRKIWEIIYQQVGPEEPVAIS